LIDGYDVSKVELYDVRLGCSARHTFLMAPCRRILPLQSDASPEAIVEAAKTAFAHEFIMALATQHEWVSGPPSLVDSDSGLRSEDNFTKSAAINPGRSN